MVLKANGTVQIIDLLKTFVGVWTIAGWRRARALKRSDEKGKVSHFDIILSWKQQADSNAATRYDTGYDPAGQLLAAVKKTDSTNAVLHQYYYNYEVAGNRVSEQVDAGTTQTSVNTLNQITSQSAGGATLFQGTISQPGTVTVNGQPAAMTPTATNFVASPVLTSGTNTVTVVAKNGGGYAQTNQYQVVIPSGSTVSPTYDADGNMTNNGNGQTYAWDAENRLVEITQGSNTYQFAYDGLGRRVSETDNGTLVKQWVWDGSTMAEERNGSGTVTKRFYPQGEQISGTAYYYTRDHLGSVREMTDSSGNIQARYDYDPYGRTTLVSGSNLSDKQYAGMYMHQTSGLYLTPIGNTYDPTVGRWLSRDPIGLNGGINLYRYCNNDPLRFVDPLGLCGCFSDAGGETALAVLGLSASTVGTLPKAFGGGALGAGNVTTGASYTAYAMNQAGYWSEGADVLRAGGRFLNPVGDAISVAAGGYALGLYIGCTLSDPDYDPDLNDVVND